MIITEEVKQKILEEYEAFKDAMYANKSREEREELGQFFTPPDVTFEMLTLLKEDTLVGKKILDPTSGSGNLLAACLIAGADSDKVFGNEYETKMVKLCRDRLNNICDMLGKPHIRDWQIHKGDATDAFCLTYFGTDYKQKLEEHFLEVKQGEYALLLFPELTEEQKEFLSEVD